EVAWAAGRIVVAEALRRRVGIVRAVVWVGVAHGAIGKDQQSGDGQDQASRIAAAQAENGHKGGIGNHALEVTGCRPKSQWYRMTQPESFPRHQSLQVDAQRRAAALLQRAGAQGEV